MSKNIASSLQNVKHLAAFENVVKHRFDNIDLSAILMYIIDTCPVEALPDLAEQFNVLGYNGFRLADSEEQKRNLIKNAIKLSSKKGTAFAIKEILKSVGFIDPEIVTNIGIEYDGAHQHNGNITYGGGNWASFRVKIGIPDNREINASVILDIRKFIEAYKSQRDHLLDISFKIYLSDEIDFEEFLDLGEGSEDTIANGIYYNGAATYNGSHQHNKGIDTVSLRVINVNNNAIIIDETF